MLAGSPERFGAAFCGYLGGSAGPGQAGGPGVARLGLDVACAVLSSLASTTHAGTLESYWERLGGRYAAQRACDDIFPAVFTALTRAARELCDDRWSSALGSDWAAMRLWVLDRLACGADRSRTLGLPVHPRVAALAARAPDPVLADPQPPTGRTGRRRRRPAEAIDDLWLA